MTEPEILDPWDAAKVHPVLLNPEMAVMAQPKPRHECRAELEHPHVPTGPELARMIDELQR